LAAVTIRDASRAFGAVRAVERVSVAIRHGEFFTLLGPSGCGKTTLLRMIAGFCELDEGAVFFGDRRIDALPPHRRNTAMVFQNYAIFPNHTVAGNVAYGLKARRVPAAETAERVRRALQLVHLDGFEERWPHQLSGGQLQRVALARSLVIEPEVLLLDEPLSNLDAQLRVEMRGEIRELQRALAITAVYVTHDQEEALAVSDRIAVMRAGRLEQVGEPLAVYQRPATAFVAAFMGATNILTGTVAAREGDRARIAVGPLEFPVVAPKAAVGARVSFSLRPEAIRLLPPAAAAPPGWAVLDARVGRVEFLGALTRMEVALAGGAARLNVAALGPPDGGAEAVRVAYDPAQATVFHEQ
jgi:ABC-type Fe3+/spermidine/putrescine transport system ATPase subunit